MDTTPGTPSPHRDAIVLAAHIVSESPGREPSALAASCAGLWSAKMWGAVAKEAGLPTPTTAVQSAVVAILAGIPGRAKTLGTVTITASAAATCETALTQFGATLTGASPAADQMRAHVRDALDELEAPVPPALRSERAA